MLLTCIDVVIRFAEIAVARYLAERIQEQRALGRDEIARTEVFAEVMRQQRETGVAGWTPGNRRGKVAAVVLDAVDAGAGLADQTVKPIAQFAVFIDRTADIKGRLFPVEAADLYLKFSDRFSRRALADRIGDATRRVRPIQHRYRAAQYLHTLQAPGFGTHGDRTAAALIHDAQTIEILRSKESSDVLPVAVGVRVGRADARCIGQCVDQVLRAAGIHFVTGDDGHRLRGFQQWRLGFAAGQGFLGDETIDHTCRGLFSGGRHVDLR